jgi:hypothetical protein
MYLYAPPRYYNNFAIESVVMRVWAKHTEGFLQFLVLLVMSRLSSVAGPPNRIFCFSLVLPVMRHKWL